MTVTQRLMKPGRFSLALNENYPDSVAQAIRHFDHIVITPTPVDISSHNDAGILAASVYTGVITRKPSLRIFEGADLSYWLGTDDGVGHLIIGNLQLFGNDLTAFITAVLAAGPVLTAGTINNSSTTSSVTQRYDWLTQREALDAGCRAYGAEWRVNPAGTLDAATRANLFAAVTATKGVVVTRKSEGLDGSLRGLDGSLMVPSSDVEKYITAAYAIGPGDGPDILYGSSAGSTTFKDLLNNTITMEKVINAPGEFTAQLTYAAAAAVGQFNTVRREIALSSDTYTVGRYIEPGDEVWVYDLRAQLFDSANQIEYRGELICPLKMRVNALTWPVERGVGVYLRRSGATPTYTDLTPYMEWEKGDVQWEVSPITAVIPRNPMADYPNAAPGSTTSGYLGSNADVAERVGNATPWTAPTLLNSWVNAGGVNANAAYRKHGDLTEIRGLVKSGALGTVIFTLPVGFRPPTQLLFPCEGNSLFAIFYVNSGGSVTAYAGSTVNDFSINCSFSTI